MIFEKANKQTSFNNTLINQIRAASHWLTYLISPRQPWGNLQTVVILYKLFISDDTSKNFPHFWPSLPEGLGGQKLVSVHSLLFHTCVNSGSQIPHITPQFLWNSHGNARQLRSTLVLKWAVSLISMDMDHSLKLKMKQKINQNPSIHTNSNHVLKSKGQS